MPLTGSSNATKYDLMRLVASYCVTWTRAYRSPWSFIMRQRVVRLIPS